MHFNEHSQRIKDKAIQLGFSYCGISKASFLEDEAPKLEQWLAQNKHGEMKWMENHFDKRLDPRKLVEGAKSVITVLLNYFPEKELENKKYKISKYAYGEDYHDVMKRKLALLMNYIQTEIGAVHGRSFVDSAPVMDKAWAKKSGLGWIGKNTNLITKKSGSFFFIGELILDLELSYDGPIKDFCGTCTRCVDACPTDALATPYIIDSNKCISYLTIELKDAIPEKFKNQMDNWVYGCDVCQDVCPWNRFSKPHEITEFTPTEKLVNMSDTDLEEMKEEAFNLLFKNSAIKRPKFKGFSRNITFIKGQKD